MVPAMPHTILKIEPEGYPGVAFHWLEVEGPFIEEWPPASYQALFGDLPHRAIGSPCGGCLGAAFGRCRRTFGRVHGAGLSATRYKSGVQSLPTVCEAASEKGETFTDAMIETYSAVLASPEFLYHCGQPGDLDDFALAERLSFFLGESIPDKPLRDLARKES